MNDLLKKEFVALRKKAIEEQFGNLNEKQREAVMATEGPLLILAGAGSGKTTVLINRILNLVRFGSASDTEEVPYFIQENDLIILKNRGEGYLDLLPFNRVEPWRILAITFTNKAASELKNRLGKALGDAAEDLWACTFHSACVRILRREAEKLGFTSSFSIYDTDDSISLIKKIEKQLDIDSKEYPPKSVLFEISRAKDRCITADEYLTSAEKSFDHRKKIIGRIYAEYMRSMFIANAMDFDDIISFTVKVLKENDDSRSYWQRRFKYILIDEYQDTNHLQYLLASLLAGEKSNLCVVGDDDQSIYKFRGATIENILSFETSFSNCRTVRLEQNYRSTSHILDAANSVISNNLSRKGKTLWTDNGTGNLIQIYSAMDQNDEAAFVANRIVDFRSIDGNWRDNAILYRMNAQSNQFEIALKRRGIPYKVVGGTKFFDRAEIKDMLSYLCVIASPGDDLRLTRIINVPARKIGEKSVELIQALAAAQSCSMFDIISEAEKYPELQRVKPRLDDFRTLIESLVKYSECNTSDLLFDYLLEQTGYVRLLEEKNTIEDTARAENVKELKTSILTYIKETGDTSLSGFLTEIALYTDLDGYDDSDDAVVMMTMHTAKGLEFPNVFIVGMEETIFPGIRSIGNQDDMEEERRLCYVAITRAMKNLFLTSAKQRTIFGKTAINRISRFIEEIPEDHIEGNIPKGFSYSDPVVHTEYPTNRYDRFIAIKKNYEEHRDIHPAQDVSYAVGDSVFHKAFGNGIIVSMKPMGGDYLVEIAFDTIGNKKLMLRAAAAHMKKLNN